MHHPEPPNEVEVLLTEVVGAVAVALATVCKEIETPRNGPYRARLLCAEALQARATDIARSSDNPETLTAVFGIFISALRDNHDPAAQIRLRRKAPPRRPAPARG